MSGSIPMRMGFLFKSQSREVETRYDQPLGSSFKMGDVPLPPLV
jgi:hypothetical protein